MQPSGHKGKTMVNRNKTLFGNPVNYQWTLTDAQGQQLKAAMQQMWVGTATAREPLVLDVLAEDVVPIDRKSQQGKDNV